MVCFYTLGASKFQLTRIGCTGNLHERIFKKKTLASIYNTGIGKLGILGCDDEI